MHHHVQRGFIRQVLLTIILGVFLFSVLYRTYIAAPAQFPAPYHIVVTEGETLAMITTQLKNDHVIRSARTFGIFMRVLGGDRSISEGEYVFDRPLSSLSIALHFTGKQFGIARTKVTFPEGYTVVDMAAHLKNVFPNFNTAQFISMAQTKEGYLFPDTYGFFGTPLPSDVVHALTENYQRKLAPLRQDIAQSGHSEQDIIVMASIIEKEAKGDSDRGMIAGILWNRISKGIPLQVDAATATYTRKGLPPEPICNPGIAAIVSALHPVSSSYLYYLHDASGAIHYASTYQQHQQNIKKYLH